MKYYFTFIVILFLVSCKSETKQSTESVANSDSTKEVSKTKASNLDFSSLFDNYICDITSSELAEVLQLPESSISVANSSSDNKCNFKLQGFGKGYENSGTPLSFGPIPSSKKHNNKVITNHLKEKKERPQGMIMGRDIILADAGEGYITLQLLQGRVLILNENYDPYFMISYGNKNSVQERTKEQHEQLTKKIIDLSNYLISKHKK
ncbi:hypothetical protein [Psychroserpens sp. Hel_I_66]|uniref:hypothetical protein n=1 Tax=Psychroserpens sp. Hel_I_66 TaxID=1250004 RepID=UPI00064684FA|nr:hypothetical protein [Psychroserpens sp. Hel_I_66]